MMNCSITL